MEKLDVVQLRKQWSRDCGPKINGFEIDYSYFSPVENGASNDKKYPLVIVLAGALEGLKKGFELEANNIAKWSDSRLQKKFYNEGAFILIARAPEELNICWDSSRLTVPLMKAVEDFCQKHNSVDTDRLYIVGWCLGATGAVNLASTFPNKIAAAIIMCPNRPITSDEANSLKHMPLWIMGAKTDSYVFYPKNILLSWKRLSSKSNVADNIRLTSYTHAPKVTLLGWIPFIFNHNLWDNVIDDMHSSEFIYKGLKTINGTKESIEEPFAISWLSSYCIGEKKLLSQSRNETGRKYKIHKFFAEDSTNFFRWTMLNAMLKAFALLGWI